MNKATIFIFAVVAAFFVSLMVYKLAIEERPAMAPPQTVGAVAAEFVRAVEGNVVEVRIIERVRLIGVRGLKGDEARAAAARNYIAATLRGRELMLRSDPLTPARDRRGLLLAYVEAVANQNQPEVNLNRELIGRGLAPVDNAYNFAREKEFEKIVAAAGGQRATPAPPQAK